jgi:MFS family permease
VSRPPQRLPSGPRLGLRANLAQFCLLVGINALVGGMVGQERSLLSLLATETFGLAAVSAALIYIVAFGLTKAATNFLAGTLADSYGRKPVLVAGWLVGLPVPLLLIWAPTWGWVVLANVLLGVNQGLCWSTTVIMKIDLAGPKRRGLAMGLHEAAGYLAVALTAYLTGLIAARAGLRPEPFYLGLAYAGLGLGLSALLVRTSLREPALSACSQAGLVNNLNDGLPWAATAMLLGVGTAMVYPTLLAAIGDVAHPSWRATAVGIYRLWRDAGFAVGALLAGLVADLAGLVAAVWVVAALTAASGLVVAIRMYETLPSAARR